MDALTAVSVRLADPEDPGVRPLIMAHLAHGRDATVQSSDHTLDIQALKGPGIRFWIVSDAGTVVGCGALKNLPDGMAEVKSVHIADAARGRGLARQLMDHMITTARRDGIEGLVLETGTMGQYKAARGLYEALGFTCCGPIHGYTPDPNSAFMRLPLST